MVKLADLSKEDRLELVSLLEEKRLREQARRAEGSLLEFIRMFWRVVDPEEPFVDGWPIRAICEHLEAVTRGEMRRLIINVPPGFSKSLCTDVFWPAWEWGPAKLPWMRYIAASYNSDLTERDNGLFAKVLNNDVYQRFWGSTVKLTRDGLTRVENDRTGWKMATSVGGSGTGHRGNRVIIDDPNNPKNVESDAVRNDTNQWLREVMPDRLNNLKEGAIVIIQQRTHEEDATGTMLKYGRGYAHLCIPMLYDTSFPRLPTPIGWVDPREYDGDLAWEERFPQYICDDMAFEKGSFAWSGQYQQTPTARGGGIIPRKSWNLWPAPGFEAPPGEKQQFPDVSFVLMAVDTASTEKEENDFSACTVWGLWHDHNGRPKVVLMEAWQVRLRINELVLKMLDTGRRRMVDRMLIENKANGINVSQEIQRLMREAEFAIELWEPKGHGDKVARLYTVQPAFDAGQIHAPDKRWADVVMDQVAQVPKGAHDDLADTCFVAGTLIATKHGNVPIEQMRVGDYVLTPVGWRRVTHAKCTGTAQTISKFGLTGTPSHPVFTLDENFTRLDTVSSASMLSRLSLCGLIRATHLKPWNSMALSSVGWGANADTTYRSLKPTKDVNVRRGCTSRYGNSTLVRRFLSGMRLITSTATRSISISIIWSVYRLACIGAYLRGQQARRPKNIFVKFGSWLRSGTDRQRGVHGMLRTALILSRRRAQQRRHLNPSVLGIAAGAASHSSPSPAGASFVRHPAAQPTLRSWLGNIASHIHTSLPCTALSMIGSVSGAAVSVAEKQPDSAHQNVASNARAGDTVDQKFYTPILRRVFNLTVEGAEAYYANGILVHNCSMALLWLREAGMMVTAREHDQDIAWRNTYRPEPEPIYDV